MVFVLILCYKNYVLPSLCPRISLGHCLMNGTHIGYVPVFVTEALGKDRLYLLA